MSVFTKIWGYEPNKLTADGVAKIVIDVTTLLVCILLVAYYPTTQVQDSPALQWLCTVGMVLITIYGVLPSWSRIIDGHYQHWIENKEGEE